MVRVRGIFQSYDAFHKRDNKKARSLDKVPKLRAFPALSYLSDNCSWKRTSQMIQCTPEKQRECVLHPTPLKFSAPTPSHLSKQTRFFHLDAPLLFLQQPATTACQIPSASHFVRSMLFESPESVPVLPTALLAVPAGRFLVSAAVHTVPPVPDTVPHTFPDPAQFHCFPEHIPAPVPKSAFSAFPVPAIDALNLYSP